MFPTRDSGLSHTQFVYEGAFGGSVTFTAEQVNYIGVGMAFQHFYALGGLAQTGSQAWNIGKHRHLGTWGEQYWADIGTQLYWALYEE